MFLSKILSFHLQDKPDTETKDGDRMVGWSGKVTLLTANGHSNDCLPGDSVSNKGNQGSREEEQPELNTDDPLRA